MRHWLGPLNILNSSSIPSTAAQQTLILLGASTRSAAYSARRAGLTPYCADLFAYEDLRDCCHVSRVDSRDYPSGLEAAARQAPEGPWAYVGALENHPDLVSRIATSRPLWGNNADVLLRIRDPLLVAQGLARMGVPYLEVRQSADGLPRDGTWLSKPIRGAGGAGIVEWNCRTAESSTVHDGPEVDGDSPVRGVRYFQRRIRGPSYSCIYVGNGREAVLLGMTRQLVGERAFHAKPFHYCGSIGPIQLSGPMCDQCVRLGSALAREFGLIGLFGVDAILNQGLAWPVEVNPRFTASMEILEHAYGVSLMEIHRNASVSGTLRAWDATRPLVKSCLGKAVLFAPHTVEVPCLGDWRDRPVAWPGRWPVWQVADVPKAGSRIAPRSPILTLFASGQTQEECYQSLLTLASEWHTNMDGNRDN